MNIIVSQNGGACLTLSEAVEISRAAGGENTILIEDGLYENSHVVLDGRDNGLTIRAAPGCKPRLCGGRRLEGWTQEADGLYSAPLPNEVSADIRLLTVDDEMRPRARYPDVGTFIHRGVFESKWMSTTAGGWDVKPTEAQLHTLPYNPADLCEGFDFSGAEVLLYHKWDATLAGVSSHDIKTNTLRVRSPVGHPPGAFDQYDYVLYNVKAGMTRPGAWRVDKTKRRVFMRPMPGEEPGELNVMIPIYDNIISFGADVSDISLEGLSLCHTGAALVTEGFGAGAISGAIESRFALKSCRFERLEFECLTGWAIKLEGGCSDVTIKDCRIRGAGAGGVKLKGAGGCRIEGADIEGIGLIHESAVGIYATCCDVVGNRLRGLSYSGIVCSGREHICRINGNRIVDAVRALNDGAGIYATMCEGGEMRGNVVENIPQSARPDSTRNGLYLDEQCRRWRVEENMTIGCTSAMMNHMASGNAVRRNAFICPDGDMLLSFIRCEGYLFEQNAVFAGGAVHFAENPGAVSSWDGCLINGGSGVYRISVQDDYRRAEPVAFSAGTP